MFLLWILELINLATLIFQEIWFENVLVCLNETSLLLSFSLLKLALLKLKALKVRFQNFQSFLQIGLNLQFFCLILIFTLHFLRWSHKSKVALTQSHSQAHDLLFDHLIHPQHMTLLQILHHLLNLTFLRHLYQIS